MKNLTSSERDEKERLISLWRSSGISQGAFCRQEGISRSTFQHWRKRYDPTYEFQKSRKKTKKFVSIEINTQEEYQQENHHLFIHYPNGVTMQCDARMNVENLKQLLDISSSS